MLELTIGFLLGILLISFLKSASVSDYMEEADNLRKENQELKEKLNKVLKRNGELSEQNERFKTRIIELINKLGVKNS